MTTATLTVADAMLRKPKVRGVDATVAELRTMFGSDHVHVALLVDDAGRLVSVVERADLDGAADGTLARQLGRLDGRVVDASADLAEVTSLMQPARRRVAVVSEGALVGLLCFKRSGLGFCTDADVFGRHPDPGAWSIGVIQPPGAAVDGRP